jgi:2-haloacid dehalogenase
MIDPATIKALTFDVFGTVVDWRSSIAREAEALLGRAKGVKADWAAFADAWRGKYQPAMDRVRKGHRGFVKLDVLHRENLVEVLKEHKIAGLSEAEIDALNRAWHRLSPWPDSVPGMTRLRRRYILASLSNGNIALIVNMAKHAGIPWDAILGAEVARSYKPRPETYHSAAEALGLRPDQCLMVAAHNDDLVAAAKCGFRTAFVARPNEHGPNQKRDFEAITGVDMAINDFEELATRLET